MNANPSELSSSLTPWGMRTRSVARQREEQLMFQVLDNPSLREEILKHAMRGNDGKLDQRTASTLRLVQTSWNHSVLRILWKSHQPLFKVVAGLEGNLGAWINSFAVSSRTNDYPPPLKLVNFSDLSGWEELQNFSTFMTSCSPALLQLGILIYKFGGPFPIALPQWSLSRLHKLEINLKLCRDLLASSRLHPEEMDCFLRSLLRDATGLAELELFITQWEVGYLMTTDLSIIESLTLPPSLLKLKLEMTLDEPPGRAFLEALLGSPLPNLTSLSVSKVIFTNGLLFSIMDKFKASLKVLEIIGENYVGPPRNVNMIRFPVMEQLEEFSITSITAELEPGQDSLERCFPKLRTLRLRQQTPEMLRKWTESSRFTGVTSLELLLADEYVSGNDVDEFFMSTSTEAMQSVKVAFPNLRKLELGISKSDPSGLWFVFQEMRQLVELKLKVFGDASQGRTTNVWDSVLTGVTVEMMARLRRKKNPVSGESGQSLVSILNLQELKSLSVVDNRSYPVRFVEGPLSRPHDNRRSLISDFIFEHAFLKMPNLTHLHFEGPFKVSDGMADKWMRQEGRSLFYQRFVNSRLGS